MLLADAVDEACGPDRDPWLCRYVADATDSVTAGNVGEALSPWVSAALIILVAFIANRIVRRIVRRSVMHWEQAGRLTVRGRNIRLLPESTTPITTSSPR